MNSKVSIVPFSNDQIDALAPVVFAAFPGFLEYGPDAGAIVARNLLLGALRYSEFGHVAFVEGSPVGLVLGHTNIDSQAMMQEYTEGDLAHSMAQGVEDSRIAEQIVGNYSQMFASYRKLFEASKRHPKGYLAFIAVQPGLQGLGVGKTLVSELEEALRNAKTSSYYLFTDNWSCNFGFYDHLGFERVAACEDGGELDSESGVQSFMYVKDI